MRRVLYIGVMIASLPGCWFGHNEFRDRLERGSTPHVEVPDDLDHPEFVNAMPIPDVDDPGEGTYRVGLPEALSTTFDVPKIVIRKLGEESWIFLDMAPPSVWSAVVHFWEDNSLTIASADPATGIIESDWLSSEEGSGETLFDDLKLGGFLPTRTTQLHKLRARIEPGVRSGSTEIYLEHHRVNAGQSTDVTWGTVSDDPELERTILTALAYNLGDTVEMAEQTVSMVASGLQESRTVFVDDDAQPSLRYRLNFDRAWVTVKSALENANINVDDLNRSEAYFYVHYTTDHRPEPGFFRRLLTRADANVLGDEDRYLLRLTVTDQEVAVTVFKDQTTLADADLAASLLKAIKEYST